jgi:hypothetical protein
LQALNKIAAKKSDNEAAAALRRLATVSSRSSMSLVTRLPLRWRPPRGDDREDAIRALEIE